MIAQNNKNQSSYSTNEETKHEIQNFSMTSNTSPIDDKSHSIESQPIPRLDYNLQVRILDVSPEWDFTTGGSKVLLVIQP